VCIYVCVIVCLFFFSFRAHVSKPLTGESSPYTRNKLNKACITLTVCTGKLLLKVGLFSGRGDPLQTSNLAFLAVFTAILQLKNTKVGLSGSQEKCVSPCSICGRDLYFHKLK